jgi:tetratricopeptide (TPR) repeat protein
MSPEALNHDHSNQRLIDIYALGITIYEMLVGKHPFTSLNKKEIDAMHKKQNYPIDNLPNWQQNFIKKAIHPDPLKRYQFMAEMEESLQAQAIPLEFNQLFFNNYKLLELVEKELSHKKWMKALHLLESVEKNSPNELLVHQGFANYYLQRGEFEKAKIRINQAFKLNNRIPYFKELGWIYLEECNYQKVIPLLTDYLRRKPNDLEGFNLLIRAYYETKRMDEALKLSTILHQQHPKLACFLNNLLVSYYCVHGKIPSDISAELKQNNHPLVDYNLALIQESVKNKMDGQSKLIFMNFNHNTMKENKIRIQSLDLHRSNTFETSDPVILIGRNAEDTINIGLQNNKGISRMHCVVLNSKNDVWIYDLKSVNGTYIDGEKIKLRQLLSGVQKLTLDQVDFWIHSDAEKLL